VSNFIFVLFCLFPKLTGANFDRTSAIFRRFSQSTFLAYRSCASRQVVLVIRFMLRKRQGKTRKLGTFCPKVSAQQAKLYKALYDQLLPGEDVNMGDIAPTAHRLLYSTFTMRFGSSNRVESAFEQSLIFSILSPKPAHYLSANFLQQLFSRTQRTCFSTLFHAARLGGPDVDYVMVEYAEEDDEDRDGVDDGEEEEDEFECGAINDAEDEMMEMDFRGPGEGLDDAGGEQGALGIEDNTDMFELANGDGDGDDEGIFEIVPQSAEGDQILRCEYLVFGWLLHPQPDIDFSASSWTIAFGQSHRLTLFVPS
jgi:hypothetical protein